MPKQVSKTGPVAPLHEVPGLLAGRWFEGNGGVY